MRNLQRKFFLISAAVHGLLFGVLLVGPAFMGRRPKPMEDLPILHVIPARLVDELVSGGGSPTAVPPEATRQPQPEPQPQPQPRVEPAPQPKPQPRVEPAPQPKPEPKPVTVVTPKPAPKPKPDIKVQKELVSRTPQKEAGPTRRELEQQRQRELERQRQDAARALEKTLAGAARDLGSRLSGQTTVEVPGPGGEAYANYRQVIKSIYDKAWIDPAEVSSQESAVLVEVTINHDGRVLNDRVLRASGIRPLDRSVQDALDRVRLGGLPPFPQGAKDLQRVFRIEFNLRDRRLAG
jgi:TonB family protein